MWKIRQPGALTGLLAAAAKISSRTCAFFMYSVPCSQTDRQTVLIGTHPPTFFQAGTILCISHATRAVMLTRVPTALGDLEPGLAKKPVCGLDVVCSILSFPKAPPRSIRH